MVRGGTQGYRTEQRPIVGEHAPDMTVEPPSAGQRARHGPPAAERTARERDPEALTEFPVGEHPPGTAAPQRGHIAGRIFAHLCLPARGRCGRAAAEVLFRGHGCILKRRQNAPVHISENWIGKLDTVERCAVGGKIVSPPAITDERKTVAGQGRKRRTVGRQRGRQPCLGFGIVPLTAGGTLLSADFPVVGNRRSVLCRRTET